MFHLVIMDVVIRLLPEVYCFPKILSSKRAMVLGGLAFSSWQAWLAGVYFVRKPWGLPTPTGFCLHPYVLYAFTLGIISYTFWTDCFMKLYPLSSQLSLTAKILADAVIFVTAIFDLYFRFTFYRINTPLSELLIALEQPKFKPFNSLLRKCWKTHKLSLVILAVPRYLLAFTLVCSFGLVTSDYPESVFYVQRYVYFGLFMLFTAVPSVASILFAYDLIVITTFHMLWTFEDYCAHLEDHIYKGYFLRKRYSLNPTPSVRSLMSPIPAIPHYKGDIIIEKCTTETNEFRNLKRLSDAEEGKGFERMSFGCFVERFDWIHGLAAKYNRCIGPIILGVVVRCVFSIVHAVNALALKTASQQMGLKSWYHVLVLLVEMSQLVILKLGSEVHERISFWKSKLNKAWLLTTSTGEKFGLGRGGQHLNSTLDSEDLTTNFDEMEYDNQLVQDLVNYVSTWSWKVSAAGIFDIDKALLSGIVSTTLTYVIILFQLNLADPKPNNGTTIPLIFDVTTNSSKDYML